MHDPSPLGARSPYGDSSDVEKAERA
jgi:hypothetical protein